MTGRQRRRSLTPPRGLLSTAPAGSPGRLPCAPNRTCSPGDRHGVDAARHLDLEHHVVVVAEGELAADQVELPHPAEALVVELADLVAALLEIGPPVLDRLGVVQPQHLDVGGPEAGLLDPGQHLGQRRAVAAGEDVLPKPGIGVARPVAPADRMQQGGTRGFQQLFDLAEEFRVMLDPDMLEHADRDDPVEALRHLAVILQAELDLAFEPGILGALLGNLELLLGERHPDHLHAGGLGEIDGQSAPAAADIEHHLARLQQQLRGDVGASSPAAPRRG